MNNDKDLFRQALQRQNERTARMKMPDDMEQRVMGSLPPSPLRRERKPIRNHPYLRRYIGIGIAATASILLLLVFHFGKNIKEECPKVAHYIVKQSGQLPPPPLIVEDKKEEVMAEVRPTPQYVKKHRKAAGKQNTPVEPAFAQAEPTIPAESASHPQAPPQPFHEARVSSMNAGNDDVDPKILLYTAEIELEKSTHQRQEASEKEMMQHGLELLIYFMTEKEEEIPARVVNTQKS